MRYFLIALIAIGLTACATKDNKKVEQQTWKGKGFTYYPAGYLKPSNSGRGRRGDNYIYAPNIRFPLAYAPAYINSQVYGIGGQFGPRGSLCDQRNYKYPWRDNYCEKRTRGMPLCPAGVGHQGVDIRAKDCRDNTHYAVAVEEGVITYIGSYSVKLRGTSGRTYRYLHLNSHSIQVRRGQRVWRGQKIGRVSDNMGKTKTSIHLHFDIKQTIRFGNYSKSVYVPPYTSLVDAYKRLLRGRP
ncbi:MAG: M23 family peptidase [Sulfurovum sp.]|nr:MAG: M23 family peptidase [Sulfurovum sp.]